MSHATRSGQSGCREDGLRTGTLRPLLSERSGNQIDGPTRMTGESRVRASTIVYQRTHWELEVGSWELTGSKAPGPRRRTNVHYASHRAPCWRRRAYYVRLERNVSGDRHEFRASSRVRLATERTIRSCHRSRYGNDGISLMWMPAHTTIPPGATRDSASGTRAPTGAKMIAASSGRGGADSRTRPT